MLCGQLLHRSISVTMALLFHDRVTVGAPRSLVPSLTLTLSAILLSVFLGMP